MACSATPRTSVSRRTSCGGGVRRGRGGLRSRGHPMERLVPELRVVRPAHEVAAPVRGGVGRQDEDTAAFVLADGHERILVVADAPEEATSVLDLAGAVVAHEYGRLTPVDPGRDLVIGGDVRERRALRRLDAVVGDRQNLERQDPGDRRAGPATLSVVPLEREVATAVDEAAATRHV